MAESIEALTVELTAADIPGADLGEPLERHGIPAMKWWLLCLGIKVPSSWKKSQFISRIRQAVEDKAKVVDVDGSHLYRKHQRLEAAGVNVVPLEAPSPPLTGWESVSENNVKELADTIPRVTAGLLYTYLAGESCNEGRSTFRALSRGYTHWASGRLDHLEINSHHPQYCHVRSIMKPSMKPGNYHVYLLLVRDGELAHIHAATCECAAGNAASCTHVSAVLHALVVLTTTEFQLQPNLPEISTDEEVLPVTSYPCQWKQPKTRKDSTLPMSGVVFEKHTYEKMQKRTPKLTEDFDPGPLKYRGTAKEHLPTLLGKLHGEGLCISVLLDPQYRHWDTPVATAPTELPGNSHLNDTITAFMENLQVSAAKAREIERDTREQHNSPLWFSVRRFRLTSSLFSAVLQCREDTPPDNLVLRILQEKQFSSPATEWGRQKESIACQEYVAHQHTHGHRELLVTPSGFLISETQPFLGASPDGAVYDPSDSCQPFGFLEIKCPYSQRNVTPLDACSASGFCCTATNGELCLRRTHPYFAQVQGQMAVGKRPWCDFVIYTTRGVSVQRIPFDQDYWDNKLLPKLTTFYKCCVAPEIVSPIHVLGMPLRNLSKV